MKKEYLNIKEASEFINKSIITIRRHIKDLKDPGIKKQKTNTGFMYFFSQDFLITHFGMVNTQWENNYKNQDKKVSIQDNQLVNQMINQVEFLKKQLEEKDKQISEINNRLKESNIINMNLQTKLQITDRKPNIFNRLFFRKKEN